MTLIRWNPINDMVCDFNGMRHNIDRIFNRFHSDILDESAYSSWMPAIDILERENDFNIKIELPGVDKNDVKITVQNDVLTIKGEKKQEGEKKSENYHYVERRYGSFQRSFTLPSSVDGAKIDASYENGVLNIIVPKIEEVKPKEIEVKIK